MITSVENGMGETLEGEEEDDKIGIDAPHDPSLYFQGLYDGIFLFNDIESEYDIIDGEEDTIARIYERFGRAVAGEWDFPTNENE